MENNEFELEVILGVKQALKEYRLPEYLRSLSQEDIYIIYMYYSKKEQIGDNKYIRECAEHLIMDNSKVRK